MLSWASSTRRVHILLMSATRGHGEKTNLFVPPQTRLLEIHVIRESSLPFDRLISGTAWIDSVRFVKIR